MQNRDDTATHFLSKDWDSTERELDEIDKLQTLRIEIDSGLEDSLRELENLQSQLPKEQNLTLLESCKTNVIETIEAQFGLMPILLSAKDGGNVHTTHNVRHGKYASDKEKERYEKRGDYDSKQYHSDKSYRDINRKQQELKEQGKLKDYMTGKKINPNDDTDLDHIVSAKTIHDDPARVLAEVDGTKLANTESNLKMTDSSLNRSKKAMSIEEMTNLRDKRLKALEANKNKRGFLTESEQNELKKLTKQKEINDKEAKRIYDEEQKKINKAVDMAYYGSLKPYKEMVATGQKMQQ